MNVTRKVGTNRGKRRVWLQGAILEAAGFGPGEFYALSTSDGSMLLRKLRGMEAPADGEHKRPRKVSGKAGMPIVDIAGDVVADTFPGAELLSVSALPGIVRIEVAR